LAKPWYGWSGTILEVDLSSETIHKRELETSLAFGFLGQSGINARLLYELAGPEMDPFSPEVPLILGVGPLGGTLAPCSGRFTATFKSPLTGIFGDSNCGGHWGPELKMAGYDHIIITGKSQRPVYLWIDNDCVQLRDARHLWGKSTWQADEMIKNELARKNVQVACIGPAGENRVHYAAIICNLARAAARCGPGAVMGSKNLKAIAVYGDRGLSIADPLHFKEAVDEAVEAILRDPLYEVASTFGTPAITGLAQALGFFPTRNFRESVFEGADKLRGEILHEQHVKRHKGCYNCPVSCSRFYMVEKGAYAGTRGEGPEYESISAFGAKCGNSNLEAILHANMLCNQYGLDTISTGNTIAWAMECYEKGLLTKEALDGIDLHWGNDTAIIQLINKIAHREGIGDLLAGGAVLAAKKIGGEEFIVHSKGMDYPAVDVRGTKGMALAFAVSPRGGDHLKGLPLYEVAPEVYAEDIKEQIGIEITPNYWQQYETKAELIRWHENWHCVVDSLGICKLEGIALKPLLPGHFARLLTAATGWEVSVNELEQVGERIWNLERLYNLREGVNKEQDYPPRRLLEEPITNGPAEGLKLELGKYEKLLQEYYALRGWDTNGRPKDKKLRELGLRADFQ